MLKRNLTHVESLSLYHSSFGLCFSLCWVKKFLDILSVRKKKFYFFVIQYLNHCIKDIIKIENNNDL